MLLSRYLGDHMTNDYAVATVFDLIPLVALCFYFSYLYSMFKSINKFFEIRQKSFPI